MCINGWSIRMTDIFMAGETGACGAPSKVYWPRPETDRDITETSLLNFNLTNFVITAFISTDKKKDQEYVKKKPFLISLNRQSFLGAVNTAHREC